MAEVKEARGATKTVRAELIISQVGTNIRTKLRDGLCSRFAGIAYSQYYVIKCIKTTQQDILTRNIQLQLSIPLAMLEEAGAVIVTVAWDEVITTVVVVSPDSAVSIIVDVTLAGGVVIVGAVGESVDAITVILALYSFYGEER